MKPPRFGQGCPRPPLPRCSPDLVGVRLDGEGSVDREHLEEEGQASLEGVLHLRSQAGGVVGDPLAQRLLGDAVIPDDGVAPGVGAHPELWETDGRTDRPLSQAAMGMTWAFLQAAWPQRQWRQPRQLPRGLSHAGLLQASPPLLPEQPCSPRGLQGTGEGQGSCILGCGVVRAASRWDGCGNGTDAGMGWMGR